MPNSPMAEKCSPRRRTARQFSRSDSIADAKVRQEKSMLLYAIHFARHVRSPVSFWIGSWRKKNCSAGSCLDNPSVACLLYTSEPGFFKPLPKR